MSNHGGEGYPGAPEGLAL